MNRLSFFLLIPGIIVTVLSTCSTSPDTETPLYDSIIPSDSTIVFTGVNIITMENNDVLTGRTVVIDDGKIQQIGKTGSLTIPENAVLLNAEGRFLIPGLFDMHVHLDENELSDYLAHGITSVRNMWGTPKVKSIIERIEAGTLRSPAVISASPGIDGTPPTWPYTQVVEDPAEALALVERLKEEGWKYLKIYNNLKPEVYRGIVEAAGKQEMRFLGHVPLEVSVSEVLDLRQYSIEHLTGYDQLLGGRRGFRAWVEINEESIPGMAAQTLQAGTWNCPTLVVLDHLSDQLGSTALRQKAEENRLKFVKALYDEGAGLLIGSDSGIGFTQPGVSLHEEMQKFVSAGLEPLEVLKIATIEAARFLGTEDEMGTITTGKRADLLLLNGHPLENIENTTKVGGIVLNGEWIPGSFFD